MSEGIRHNEDTVMALKKKEIFPWHTKLLEYLYLTNYNSDQEDLSELHIKD